MILPGSTWLGLETGPGVTTNARTVIDVTTAAPTSNSEDEPTSTQVDDMGDSQATEVGDENELVGPTAIASYTVDRAGIVIALNSNRSDANGGRSEDSLRLREPSRTNGSPGSN